MLGCLLCAAVPAEQERAWALLDRISQHECIQAHFVYSSYTAQGAAGLTLEGTIALQGARYRLKLAHQEVVCDGTTVWTYLSDVNEVQIMHCTTDATGGTPWNILQTYRQDYTLARLDTQIIDACSYDTVSMVAQDVQHALPQCTLTVERASGSLQALEVVDQDQTRHMFSITNFTTPPAIDETFFTFIPEDYADIEVIDMRRAQEP